MGFLVFCEGEERWVESRKQRRVRGNNNYMGDVSMYVRRTGLWRERESPQEHVEDWLLYSLKKVRKKTNQTLNICRVHQRTSFSRRIYIKDCTLRSTRGGPLLSPHLCTDSFTRSRGVKLIRVNFLFRLKIKSWESLIFFFLQINSQANINQKCIATFRVYFYLLIFFMSLICDTNFYFYFEWTRCCDVLHLLSPSPTHFN